MIPFTLADWTVESIANLATKGPLENDLYDFKGDLQGLEQCKPVAAFANTRGGFLVFGVTKSGALEGVNPIEFPKRFGDLVKSRVEPSADYQFSEPLPIGTLGKALFVVHIPRSLRGPHAVKVDDTGCRFLTRIPAGSNVAMTYEEIRLAFQDTEFRRTKLALLSSELAHIGWVAERLLAEIPENTSTDGIVKDWAWMTRYPTTVVDMIIGDAFSLFSDKTDIQAALAKLRDETRRSNEIAAVYSNYNFILSTANPQQRKKLYELMRDSAGKIQSTTRNAKKLVDAVLAGNYGKLIDSNEPSEVTGRP